MHERRVSPARPGERLLVSGLIVATFGVAVAMAPGSFNPFGPVKAFILLAGCTCIAAGFALTPGLVTRSALRMAETRGAWAGLALVGIAALATATSIDHSQSLVGHYPEYQGLLLLLASALAGLAGFALAEQEAPWRWLGRAAVVAALVVAGYAALQFAGADPVSYERVFLIRRVRSTLGNASNLGVWLCLVLPLLISHARAEKGAWRWLSWIGVASAGVTLAWSLSRGSWVGALAGACVWLLAEGRGWERAHRLRIAGAAIAGALCFLALTVALVPTAGGRLAGLLDPSTGTPGWRAEVWSASSRLIAARPLLGYGPASFRYAFPPVRTASMQAGETGTQALDDPHNLLVSAGVSAGIVGLLALLWLLGEAGSVAWRRGDAGRRGAPGAALLASLVAGVVALQFHFATLDTAPLLAAVIGLALGGASAEHAAEAPSTPAVSPAWTLAARLGASLLAVALLGVTLLSGGLVAADREVAAGYAIVSAGGAWSDAKPRFERAVRLAPWEPAMTWALGRAATESMQQLGTDAAFGDAQAAMMQTVRRLPLDPLAMAQAADAYLIGGLVGKDPSRLEGALSLAQQAIAADPENGYRWAAEATALAALGRTAEATVKYQCAVQYAPDDAQAWAGLASMYDRMGETGKAAEARQHAAAGQ